MNFYLIFNLICQSIGIQLINLTAILFPVAAPTIKNKMDSSFRPRPWSCKLASIRRVEKSCSLFSRYYKLISTGTYLEHFCFLHTLSLICLNALHYSFQCIKIRLNELQKRITKFIKTTYKILRLKTSKKNTYTNTYLQIRTVVHRYTLTNKHKYVHTNVNVCM